MAGTVPFFLGEATVHFTQFMNEWVLAVFNKANRDPKVYRDYLEAVDEWNVAYLRALTNQVCQKVPNILNSLRMYVATQCQEPKYKLHSEDIKALQNRVSVMDFVHKCFKELVLSLRVEHNPHDVSKHSDTAFRVALNSCINTDMFLMLCSMRLAQGEKPTTTIEKQKALRPVSVCSVASTNSNVTIFEPPRGLTKASATVNTSPVSSICSSPTPSECESIFRMESASVVNEPVLTSKSTRVATPPGQELGESPPQETTTDSVNPIVVTLPRLGTPCSVKHSTCSDAAKTPCSIANSETVEDKKTLGSVAKMTNALESPLPVADRAPSSLSTKSSIATATIGQPKEDRVNMRLPASEAASSSETTFATKSLVGLERAAAPREADLETSVTSPPARPTSTTLPPARPTSTTLPPARPTSTTLPPARPTSTTLTTAVLPESTTHAPMRPPSATRTTSILPESTTCTTQEGNGTRSETPQEECSTPTQVPSPVFEITEADIENIRNQNISQACDLDDINSRLQKQGIPPHKKQESKKLFELLSAHGERPMSVRTDSVLSRKIRSLKY